MLEYAHESFSRNTQFDIPFLNLKFKFKLPPPRKARLILNRDLLGRIIHSKPPAIKFDINN